MVQVLLDRRMQVSEELERGIKMGMEQIHLLALNLTVGGEGAREVVVASALQQHRQMEGMVVLGSIQLRAVQVRLQALKMAILALMVREAVEDLALGQP